MSRFIVALLLLTGVLDVWGQTADRSRNGLRPGDTPEFARIEFADTVTNGDGAVWDLSQCSTVSGFKLRLEQAGDSSSVVGCAVDRTMYYYRVSGDSVLTDGFENNQSDMHYDRREVSLLFPIRSGSLYAGEFHGEGRYCDRWYHEMSGSYRTAADATGSLIMPEGDTIPGVVRLRTWREVDSRYYRAAVGGRGGMTDSLRFYQDERRWYAPGYRYPLLMTSTMIGADGKAVRSHRAYYSSVAMGCAVDNDPENEDLRQLLAGTDRRGETFGEDSGDGVGLPPEILDCTFSQNRGDGKVSVTFSSAEAVDVEIVLSDAMGIVYATERRTAYPGEPQTVTFDYGRLPQTANYGLSVIAGTERHSEKFHR